MFQKTLEMTWYFILTNPSWNPDYRTIRFIIVEWFAQSSLPPQMGSTLTDYDHKDLWDL